ncbi:MAG: glycosyl transferase, partial [Verrucomicrobia bacterium]
MISLTALVLTKNEESNIGRTLEAIRWIDNVLIIDSFSSDLTLDIARSCHPNIRVVQREFLSFADQCNFGLSQIETEWVLSLDADYILQPELAKEIQQLTPPADVAGYSGDFIYCIGGKPLRGTVYPSRTVLYRRGLAHCRDEGHGHRVEVKGRIERLEGKIYHDDRKPFGRWMAEQKKYVKLETAHLRAQPFNELSPPDKLRRAIFFAPPAMFYYTLLMRGLILDGW